MTEQGLTQVTHDLEQAVASIPLAQLPALLGTLEKAKAVGWGRMHTGAQHGQGEPTKNNALTAKQVASILNVKPSFVYDMARQNKLKSYRVGKYVRFKESAVHDYLARGGA